MEHVYLMNFWKRKAKLILKQTKRIQPWHLTLLSLMVLWILITRLHAYHEPISRDLANHAVIAQQLLRGFSLYGDYWQHKPPGSFLIYGFFQFIAGNEPFALYVMNVFWVLVVMMGMFFIGSHEDRTGKTGLWMALLWTVFSGDLFSGANHPHNELFINGFLVWAFYFLIKEREFKLRTAILIGLLFSGASLIKQIALAPALAMVLGLVLVNGRRRDFHKVWPFCAKIGLTLLMAWFFVSLYFLGRGTLNEFYKGNIIYNLFYANWNTINSTTFLPFVMAAYRKFIEVSMSQSFNRLFLVSHGIIVYLGVMFAVSGVERNRWILYISYLAGVTVAVIAPGRFHHHYYQFYIPTLILGCLFLISSIEKAITSETNRFWVGLTLKISIFLLLFMRVVPFYALTPDEWAIKKLDSTGFVEPYYLSKEINRLLEPNESVYNLGKDPQFYYYTQRPPPNGNFVCR